MQATEFNHIASHLRPCLLEAARQILHDEDEAEDAVQDALVSLWRWRERVDTQRDVESLLQRILRNSCLNILTVRRRRRALAAPLEELPSSTLRSLTARSNDPHASLEEKESELRVSLALSQLPPRWQRVLTMRLLDDLDNAQIASILGLSQTATSSLINRARTALLQNLKQFSQ